jgi:general secretion pathway protein B
MNVDLHVYAERPAERFALINMAKFREGDEIGRGLTLQRITPTGLVIAYAGDTFRIDTRY